MREARALAEECLEFAEPQGDALVLAAGHWMVAYAACWQGDVIDVRDHSHRFGALQPTLTAPVSRLQPEPGNRLRIPQRPIGLGAGLSDGGGACMDHTVAQARSLGHPFTLGMSLLFSAQLSQLRRDPRTRARPRREAIDLSVEYSLVTHRSSGVCCREGGR